MRGTVLQVSNTPINRASYGLGSKNGFQGMGTFPFFGQGEQLVQNMQLDSGFYRKMKGNTLLNEISGTSDIHAIGSYRKDDGTYQTLEFYNDGTNNKMRAVEEDGTVVTPSGGAGDVNFGSTTMGVEQIGLDGYISTKDTAANGNLWSWDGTMLTAMTNCPDYPEFLRREGQRLVTSAQGVVHFSQRSTATLTSFTGGTGISQGGNYNVSGIAPTGAVGVQSGIIIFFANSAELHMITPNDTGDDLSGETRVTQWNYRGQGIENNNQVVGTDTYIYIINSEGLIQIDPYTGRSDNLIEQSGAMRRYFDNIEKDGLVIGYAPKERIVVFTAKNIGSASNDQLVCYHIPYGNPSKRILPFYIKTNVSPRSLGVVGNKLYYGSQDNGRVFEVFADNTFQDGDDSVPVGRIITEWDSMGSPKVEKRMQKATFFVNLHPDSTLEANLFLDGVTTPLDSLSTSQQDIGDNSSLIAAYGTYVMGMGAPSSVDNTDIVRTEFFNSIYGTSAFEITEQSDNDFRIYNIDVQYTMTPTSSGAKEFYINAYNNKQF